MIYRPRLSPLSLDSTHPGVPGQRARYCIVCAALQAAGYDLDKARLRDMEVAIDDGEDRWHLLAYRNMLEHLS